MAKVGFNDFDPTLVFIGILVSFFHIIFNAEIKTKLPYPRPTRFAGSVRHLDFPSSVFGWIGFGQLPKSGSEEVGKLICTPPIGPRRKHESLHGDAKARSEISSELRNCLPARLMSAYKCSRRCVAIEIFACRCGKQRVVTRGNFGLIGSRSGILGLHFRVTSGNNRRFDLFATSCKQMCLAG
ncbi:MAG: hypothetical protein ABI651_05435 [Verrucomicrobiota bacterium]